MQGPLRVVQVGPAQGAEVGAAGQQDRVDVVIGGDDADRDHRHTVLAADLVADPVRVRRLVAAAERRALVADHLAGGHVHAVHPVLGEGPGDLHRLIGVDAPLVPVRGRDPHRDRAPGRPHRPDRVQHLQREAQPVLQRPAVGVGALVAKRGQEL